MAQKNEEIASTLNKFNLYFPEDQAAIQSVVEDYFTCREDESEPIPKLEGVFFLLFFLCVLMEKLLIQLQT